jgi:hypothetical protein
MAEIEIEVAGRRATLEVPQEEAGRVRALARRLEATAAPFAEEPDRATFFARVALALAAEIDEATARIDDLARTLREEE